MLGLAGSVMPASSVLWVPTIDLTSAPSASADVVVAIWPVCRARTSSRFVTSTPGGLEQAAAGHPQAQKYVDYRKLLDQNDLDAVVIATPDHHHAPATFRAMRRGLHVYCEKPLTHTVEEARKLTELTAQLDLATQMGTQNHEHPSYLRTVELIQAGAIGPVREVHVRTDRPGTFWQQGVSLPTDTPPDTRDAQVGPLARVRRPNGPTTRRTYRSSGAAFGTSVAARSATWRST